MLSPRAPSPRGLGSPRLASPRLPPLSARPSVSAQPGHRSAQIRGGGRLFVQSPVAGYSEPEMIREAKFRLEHNRHRQRLKQLLATAADGGSAVRAQDLMLACQLAKVPIDPNSLQKTPFAVDRGRDGSPRAVAWKGFHEALEYPALHGHGAFGQLPPTRSQLKKAGISSVEALHSTSNNGVGAVTVHDGVETASDMEVYSHWLTLKRLMDTRFSEIRRAFRLIDEDSSGSCDRDELKFMLNAMFNLSIPDPVLNRLIDLADFDGDGVINFAEFARIMTTDNILNMKQTLVADVSSWGKFDPTEAGPGEVDIRQAEAARNRNELQGGKEHNVKLRRTGPGLAAIRKAHSTYKKEIMARYHTFKEAFNAIDEDGSGLIRRSELRRFMRGLSKSIPDKSISALIDFCDADGDAKSLDIHEFVKV